MASPYKLVSGSRIHVTAVPKHAAKIRIAPKVVIEAGSIIDPEVQRRNIDALAPIDTPSGEIGTIALGAGVYIGENSVIQPPSAASKLLFPTHGDVAAPTSSAIPLPHLVSSGKVGPASYDTVIISDGVRIGAEVRSRASYIGHEAHIGDKAILCDGCIILNGAVVAPRATVPAGAVVAPMSTFGAVEKPGILTSAEIQPSATNANTSRIISALLVPPAYHAACT